MFVDGVGDTAYAVTDPLVVLVESLVPAMMEAHQYSKGPIRKDGWARDYV